MTITLSDEQIMALAANRIEELLQDLSKACDGRDSYDFGTVALVKELRERGQ